ncbi:N-acetylmuramoyl-L-alanine amidase AmiC precursor [Clostridium vincentii]|uniref:N-acetylmuramoyl-L-alanine amidase AmiC n=2 Tax=Clostridium vincentii TaxID=52704 RepID=A0A2T0BI35_9CLOT|nr:N-acetylmuramoyl-L-alanine amidase AmiC precursor [Clostridium vincentii]
MKIKRFIIGILIVIMSLSTVVRADESKGVILIDAGHGGVDGGAQGKNGTVEKHINLAISEKLKKSLEDEGYKVCMTREDDNSLGENKISDLNARCKMKKETNCDVFISIHQNKFSIERCFGSQVWYANNDKSSNLAIKVQESLKENTDDNNKRLAKSAKDQYKILRDGYDGACVIVECGFLSNYNEEKRLKTEEHQDKIVKGITGGINKYFEEK